MFRRDGYVALRLPRNDRGRIKDLDGILGGAILSAKARARKQNEANGSDNDSPMPDTAATTAGQGLHGFFRCKSQLPGRRELNLHLSHIIEDKKALLRLKLNASDIGLKRRK